MLLISIITLYIILSLSSTQIFIDSQSSCITSCTGTLSQPYNSIWAVLQENPSNSNLTIYLLKNSQPHYLFASELNSQGNLISLTAALTLSGNYFLLPLFSDNPIIGGNSTLLGLSYTQGEYATVYLKNEGLTLSFQGSLGISNIILNGVEDIEKYNSASTNLTTCLQTRILCCENGQLFPNVKCLNQGGTMAPSLNAFIQMNDGTTSKPSLVIQNCGFNNLRFTKVPALI